MEGIINFFENLSDWLNVNPETQEKLVISLVILVALWLAGWLARRTLLERIQNHRLRYQWKKTSSYLLFIITLVLIGPIWVTSLRSFATYFGLLSAGLAIALKDPITDLMGWMFILWRKPFVVGDRIQIGEYAGDVIDQRIFQFSLMEIGNWVDADQSTGRILNVPNGKVFTSILANYTRGSKFIWNEIPVLVTFESDWEKAKRILDDIAEDHVQALNYNLEDSFKEASRRYMIQYSKLSSTVYTSVRESGILLTIRYLCAPRRRRDSTQMVWEAILRRFASHDDIQFAYPTQRFYNYALENFGDKGDK